MIRARAYFSGHVQGVGFRATTRQIASQFSVTGYVKNLADGRVEAVAEGETSEVEGFLEAVQQRMDGFIRNVSIDKSGEIVGYGGFEITY